MQTRSTFGIATASLLMLFATEGFGRGFGGGGAHGGFGGGMSRGGYGGGGFSGGMSRGGYGGGFSRPAGGFGGGVPGGGFDRGAGGRPDMGGFDRGNFGGPGGIGPGGLDRGGLDRGGEGWNRGNFGQAPTRSNLDHFLGLPSDEGLHGGGDNFDVNHGSAEGPRGGVAHGTTVEGPRGNTYGRGVAKGPDGGVVAGRGVEGAGGGKAGQGIAVGPGGRVAGGAGVRGPGGYGAGRGFVAGPHGYAAGFSRVTPTARYSTGVAVRNNFHDWGIYRHGWYTHHPGAWFAAGWAAGAAWEACTWGALGGWFGYPAAVEPVYYDYGTNVTYDDGNVYVDDQPVGTAEEYYDQAQSLAAAGSGASDNDPGTDGEWMPLGVFALSRAGHDQSSVAIQLAVNQDGAIRGNYTDTFSDKPMVVHGSVDKKTQRVAFTVGDKTSTVFETGLYNLTKDEAPLLIHFGKDRTEQWMLVRLKQPDQATDPVQGADNGQ